MRKILISVGVFALAGLVASCAAHDAPSSSLAQAPEAAVSPATSPLASPETSASETSPTPVSTPSPTPTTTPPPSTKKPAPPVTKVSSEVPCKITTGACVDLSAHKAWLLKDGAVTYGPVPALPGRKGYATPTGMFHVLYKEKMHYSKQFNNAPMPNSVFFYPGDAFHTGSLTQFSHGCIHLSSSASLKFFNTLRVGDAVQVVP